MQHTKTLYKLWFTKGKWCCHHVDMLSSYCEGDTGVEALTNAVVAYGKFKLFLTHMDGKCEIATCEYCKEGKPSRGCFPQIHSLTPEQKISLASQPDDTKLVS